MDAPFVVDHALPPFAPQPERTAPGIVEAAGLIVVYFLLQLLIGGLLGLAITVVRTHRFEGVGAVVNQPGIMIWVVVGTLIGAATITLSLVRWRWRPWVDQAGPAGLGIRRVRPELLMAGFVCGLVVPFVGGWLTELLAGNHEISQTVTEIALGSSLTMRLLLVVVVVSVGPFVEEVLFRGTLLAGLRARMSTPWAITLSSVVFALVHLPDIHWTWYALPNLALIGVLCAWLRVTTGSLWPAVLAHAANNLVATVAWFVLS
jgi:membrane protease YdiL (CAAX protease family)